MTAMKPFFDKVREFFGPMTAPQVVHLEALFKATGGLPLMHRAYILATAWHETMQFKFMTELGSRDYFSKYNAGTKLGTELGNSISGDGYKFRGRGYVMLTGRRNYAKAAKAIGVDLVGNPDKATVPEIASVILVLGMRDGWFTGKKLADYPDYRNMRRVVNGTDKAAQIAEMALNFEKAMAAVTIPTPPLPVPPPPPVPAASKGLSIQQVMIGIILAIAGAIAAYLGLGR